MSQDHRQTLFERLQNALDEDRAQTPEQAIAALTEQLDEANPRPDWSEPLIEHFIERLEAAAGVCIQY